jgi:hypothetical protein
MRKLLLALALLSAACSDSSSGPDPVEIEGSWQGTFQVPSGGAGSLTMTLQESGGQVNGNGSITGPTGSLAITISGTFQRPNAALAIAAQGFNDLSLTAVVGEETMSGTFQGSGFTGTAITLHRQ